MSPRFSIVIPTIGRLQFLRRALDSALRQQGHIGEYEVVVLDNCSTDGTWNYLQRIDSSRVKLHRTPRRLSQGKSWNEAVRVSSGDFVYILQDDNIVAPALLSTIECALARHDQASLACFGYRYIDGADRVQLNWRPEREQMLPAPHGLLRYARDWTTCSSFLMFARAAFDRYGGFDEEGPDYPVLIDAEFILRWMTHCATLVVPEVLAMHRHWPGTITVAATQGLAEASSRKPTPREQTPEMVSALTYVVERVARFAADSGQLDSERLRELRAALEQTFLEDVFWGWAELYRRGLLTPPPAGGIQLAGEAPRAQSEGR